MKKLLLLLLFVPLVSFGQGPTTYYYDKYLKTGDCGDLYTYLLEGSRIHTSGFASYESSAIAEITWRQNGYKTYAIVKFQSDRYTDRKYIYGGWTDSASDMRKFINAFEKSESKGTFFHQYIRQAKVNCN